MKYRHSIPHTPPRTKKKVEQMTAVIATTASRDMPTAKYKHYGLCNSRSTFKLYNETVYISCMATIADV